MTSRHCFSHLVASLALSLALPPAAAQVGSAVQGAELEALVSSRTLAISFYGDPTNPALTFVWDFGKDGSLCARLAGSKRGEPCAEQGKWTANAGVLCWELPSIGKSHGFNPACSTVRREASERYELRNQKAPDLSFAKFLPLPP